MEIEVDLHGLFVDEAKHKLERLIASRKEVKRIRGIHGYKHGSELKNMVRNKTILRSRRIIRRLPTLNRGETILELD